MLLLESNQVSQLLPNIEYFPITACLAFCSFIRQQCLPLVLQWQIFYKAPCSSIFCEVFTVLHHSFYLTLDDIVWQRTKFRSNANAFWNWITFFCSSFRLVFWLLALLSDMVTACQALFSFAADPSTGLFVSQQNPNFICRELLIHYLISGLYWLCPTIDKRMFIT